MATYEKWEKVFASQHLYKDDIPIYFGNDSDAHITWDSSNATLDVTGATQFTGAMGIAGDVTLVGDVTTTGETTKMVVTNPTSATYAFYADIGAGGATGWTSGNVCGIRCEVDTTCTGTINDITGGWFGLTFDTGFTALGTGMSCAISAEVVSVVGRAATAILALQSVPGNAATDFDLMPYIYFGEVLTAGTGSGVLFATDSVTTGSGKVYYANTIHVLMNGDDRYIPLSTATGAYTSAHVITTTDSTASTDTASGSIITSGGLGVAGRGNFGSNVIVTTGVTTTATNGLYSVLTSTGAAGYTGSMAGVRGRVYIQNTVGSLGNAYGGWFGYTHSTGAVVSGGLTCGVYAEADSETAAVPSSVAYFQVASGATANYANMPILVLADGSTNQSNYAFSLGFAPAANTVSSGSATNILYQQTIHIMANGSDAYIPYSTAAGTFTYGADAAGYDAKLFGALTGYYLNWDASANSLLYVGDLAVASSSGSLACINVDQTISAGTVCSGTYLMLPIFGILTIEGSGGTAWSGGDVCSVVSGYYYTDDGNNIKVTAGMHTAMWAQFAAGQYYDATGGGSRCMGILVNSATHASATIDFFSGIYIARTSGTLLPWTIGLEFQDSASTTCIDIGTATTGIDFTGTYTTGAINVGSSGTNIALDGSTQTRLVEIHGDCTTAFASGSIALLNVVETVSANTDVTGTGMVLPIFSQIEIEGSGSTTLWSSTSPAACIGGWIGSDGISDISQTNGHLLAGWFTVAIGDNFTASGSAFVAGLLINSETHASAVMNGNNYSGIRIMKNSAKLDWTTALDIHDCTYLLRIEDDSAVCKSTAASPLGDIQAQASAGYIRVLVGNSTVKYIALYDAN